MSIDITVEGGKSKRLLTAGCYCPEDIVVTAEGGGSDLSGLLDNTITEIDDAKATKIKQYVFYSVTNLVKARFRAVETVAAGPCIYNCSALEILDFDVVTAFQGSGAISSCKVLKALVIRSSTVCTTGPNLSSTLISDGTGYIYVPSSLVSTYKAATNWASFADQFRALEDYTVDGTVSGDLDESKI